MPLDDRPQSSLSDDDAYYSDVLEYTDAILPSRRAVQFLDTAPKPLVVQISLKEYFERVKRHRADRWQEHLCNELQAAAEHRHVERYWGIIHAEGQLGKTTIISQCFPAWLFGHDPLFRFALAMYNVTRSYLHSSVVIQIMQSPIHRDIFQNREGWLFADATEFGDGKSKKVVSKTGWRTNARRELNDGQLSFNPVGLQSGLTGSGFDWLGIDDPYRESKEAFSEQVRQNMANFWEYTVMSRVSLHSCITGMFHRYAPEDFAGYLLDTSDFKYLRYASECDGDYIHDNTGQVFPDPLERAIGELISPDRRPLKYYEKARKNNRVWLSMFQGRPSSEEGEFFNTSRIGYITAEEAETRRQECVCIVRSYDHAASEEEGAAYTVGMKMGIRADGRVTVFDMIRERLDTGKRLQKQHDTAVGDGPEVVVTVPKDPGAAGDAVVFQVEQRLEGFTVVSRATSGSKEDRARNYSSAVNEGMVDFVVGDWNDTAKREMRDFPLSEYKDIVDASADGYNELYERFRKGLVVKNYNALRQLVSYNQFAEKFPFEINGQSVFRIPKRWTVYAGLRIQAEASKPTSAIVVVRAPVISRMEEHLFVIAEYKELDPDVHRLFKWLKFVFEKYCEDAKDATVWLHPDSEQYLPLIRQKLDQKVVLFDADEFAGITELDWYMLPYEEAHPFNTMQKATRLMLLVPEPFITTSYGKDGKPAAIALYGTRHEMATWGYTDKGLPSGVGQVLNCLRMVTHMFKTRPDQKTLHERYLEKLEEVGVKPIERGETITPERQMEMQSAQEIANEKLQREMGLISDEEDEDEEFY